MPFLSGETVKERLNELILDNKGQPAGKNESIDCNAYTLCVGPEICVTNENKSRNSLCRTLDNNADFIIPSGQFALILTEEVINIPNDIMGFI